MLDKNYSPLLLFAAYAQAVRALSNLSYVGDLAVVHASIKRARVFASDEQCVIVVFAGPQAGHVMLDSRLPCQRIEGIDGRIISASSQQTIPTSDGITYIWTDYHSIAPLLKTDTRAMQLYAAGRGGQTENPIRRLLFSSMFLIQNRYRRPLRDTGRVPDVQGLFRSASG